MQNYKVGIIGCGRIAGYLEDDPLRHHPCTHVGAYQSIPGCDVVACCSRDEHNVKRFADRFAIPRWYTQYRDLLASEDLDIVSIATYAPSHAEITIAAAHSKVKGIFCEKSMATSLEEADAMIAACAQHSVVLSVNHTRRWGRDYLKAKEMIASGALGRLQSINGTFSGNLFHTGIHMFDCMIYFAGEPETVWGVLEESREEARISSGYRFTDDIDTSEDKDGVITIQFRNGVIGQALGLGKRYFIFEMDIQGTEGRIRIGNGLFQYWSRNKSKRYVDFYELERQPRPALSNGPSGLVFAARDLIEAIEDNREPLCSGREARRSLEVTFAAHESHERGGIPVKLPLANTMRKVVSR